MSAPPIAPPPAGDDSQPEKLVRGIGLVQATSLNVANMVGVGPFITIPLFVASMGGPQALVGWVIAAVLVLCDGLVWSELGAAMPGSGGTYHFLREIYGRYRGGRLIAFLFIWQFMISGTLELASGYIGAAGYLAYSAPSLTNSIFDLSIFRLEIVSVEWSLPLFAGAAGTERVLFTPWIYRVPRGWSITWMQCVAAISAIAISVSLCRNIRSLASLAVILCAGTLITTSIVIVAGILNFDSSLIQFPPDAFRLDTAFASGLSAAMLIAIYDYLGYYNVCHMGDEVVAPEKTIPRAVMISVVVVAAIYMTMNIAIMGVVPTDRLMASKNIAADFMEILYGHNVAIGFSFFIIWAALASVFVMTLGYSRILYAAARNGDFFRVFGHLNPRGKFPTVALLALGVLTGVFCFFSLEAVILAAVMVRIVVQFLGQIVGLHLLHTTRPDVKLPFRMWLYPIPSLIAAAGWLFVLVAQYQLLPIALAVVGSGIVIYPIWRRFVKATDSAVAA
jgi:APA family basic amino acid/polyamine antiporter